MKEVEKKGEASPLSDEGEVWWREGMVEGEDWDKELEKDLEEERKKEKEKQE